MARLLFVGILLICSLPDGVLHAQLRASPAPSAREPARIGLLGGLREAREERLRRDLQAAQAAQRAASSKPSPNPRPPVQQPLSATNSPLRKDTSGKTTPALNNQPSIDAARLASGSQIRGAASRGSSSAVAAKPNVQANKSRTAAASLASPLAYNGPGVVIRLPSDSPSPVNYLVDEIESNSIRPGDQQVLDDKRSYIVRYSRGVTADGRSFGESRYTVSEGRYRFELTKTGWELYREGEINPIQAPPNSLDIGALDIGALDSESLEFASSGSLEITNSRVKDALLVPEPSPQSDLLPLQPAAKEPESIEEVLPAPKPRSILE